MTTPTKHASDAGMVALWKTTCEWCGFKLSARTENAVLDALLEHCKSVHVTG